MSGQDPHPQVGDVVDGRCWTGSTWEPVEPLQPPGPGEDYVPVDSAAATPGPRLPTGLAVTSLVLAIFGMLGLPLLAVPAIAAGVVAYRRWKAGTAGGRGMAIAGIVIGALTIVFYVILLAAAIAVYLING